MSFSNDFDAKVYVAGHKGLVGSAVVKALNAKGYRNIIFRASKELDLRDSAAVRRFFQEEKPDYVFLAAAKVGGILANKSFPADFIYDNLAISINIVNSCYETGVKKLLYMGSSCIYPRQCPQPMKEEYLLTGLLEETNKPFAIAKLAGIELCQSYNRQHNTNYISVMPTNIYGPNDNFDLQMSHVASALIRKFYEASVAGAPSVEIWGTGSPRREFIYVDDLAEGLLFLMDKYNDSTPINIGIGEDVTIAELARTIAGIGGYKGSIVFNSSMPDGTPQKLLDCTKIRALGWQPKVSLEKGLTETYKYYREFATKQ